MNPSDSPFDQEQENLILDSLDRFLATEVLPHVHRLEHDDIYPAEIVEKMKAMGLFGCLIAPQYGGLGLATTTYAKMIELNRGAFSKTGRIEPVVLERALAMAVDRDAELVILRVAHLRNSEYELQQHRRVVRVSHVERAGAALRRDQQVVEAHVPVLGEPSAAHADDCDSVSDAV